MSMRSKATRLSALVGAAALMGGLALSAVASVGAQTGTATPASAVGGPQNVPSARIYGTVSGPVGSGAVTASIGGVACGFGTVMGNMYQVDVQAIPGCTAPGATVTLSVGGVAASPTTSLPPIQGSPVLDNLTVVAATATPPPVTSTPPPPPPPPPPSATARPATATPAPPPPPPPPPSASPRPPTASATARPATASATARPATASATARPSTATAVTQKPNAPVAQKANAPVAQKAVGVAAAAVAQKAAAAPVAQRPVAAAPVAVAAAPGAAAAAPAARVALPNTGTGGLLDQRDGGTASFALLSIILGAVLLSATGLVSYRRSR